MSNHKNDIAMTATEGFRRVVFTVAAFAVAGVLLVAGLAMRSDAAGTAPSQGVGISSCSTGNYSSYSGGFCDKRQGHGHLPKWFRVTSYCGMAAALGAGSGGMATAAGFGGCLIGGAGK